MCELQTKFADSWKEYGVKYGIDTDEKCVEHAVRSSVVLVRGTNPCVFDWERYIRNNADLQRAFIKKGRVTCADATSHYLNHGINENRKKFILGTNEPYVYDFDWKIYDKLNPDVFTQRNRGETIGKWHCFRHWCEFGHVENRKACIEQQLSIKNDASISTDDNINKQWRQYLSNVLTTFKNSTIEEIISIVHTRLSDDDKQRRISYYPLIVMPTYNRAANIENSIQMIINQTEKKWTFLIIDDGSTIENKILFRSIQDKYRENKKIVFLENETNKHIAFTLNRGIQHFLQDSKFTHFTWVSDDNEYYPNFLEKLYISGKDFTYSWYDIYYTTTSNYGRFDTNKQALGNFESLLERFDGCAAFLWSRCAIRTVGMYTEVYPGCEDYEFLLRTFDEISMDNIEQVPISLMKYNRHPDAAFEKIRDQVIEYTTAIRLEFRTRLYTKKISIVMAYYNRKPQTLETLRGFERIYAGKYNFEVIIVDDNSNYENRLEEDIKQFTFPINLIVISKEEKGDRINPCTAYNRGFAEATGDIIVIQNPEIYHCGNILEYVLQNTLQVKNNYVTLPVFSSPSFNHNSMLYGIQNDYYHNFVEKINYKDYDFNYEYYINKYPEFQYMTQKDVESDYLKHGIKINRVCNEKGIFFRKNVIHDWKGWYNHHINNPRNLHFLSVISKNNLNKIGGFCDIFKYGLWYDDDDFLYRIKKITNVITLDSTKYFGVHQYHLSGSDDQHNDNNFNKLVKRNKDIFEYNKNKNIIDCSPFKIGLCFKLFVNDKTTTTRYGIIEEFFNSLNNLSKYYINLHIVGVIDCKINDRLKCVIDKVDTKNITLIDLKDNYGISYATNRGIIELIDRKCEYIFCSDDDMIFKQYSILDHYIRCSLIYNIKHLGYYPRHIFKNPTKNINDEIVCNRGFAGCFYMLRTDDILHAGLLPLLKSKYGYEHETFTRILTGTQYDLIDSNDYIELNNKSIDCCSGSKLVECNLNIKPTEFKLIPYNEMKLIMNLS